jgi:hypothetical protein
VFRRTVNALGEKTDEPLTTAVFGTRGGNYCLSTVQGLPSKGTRIHIINPYCLKQASGFLKTSYLLTIPCNPLHPLAIRGATYRSSILECRVSFYVPLKQRLNNRRSCGRCKIPPLVTLVTVRIVTHALDHDARQLLKLYAARLTR